MFAAERSSAMAGSCIGAAILTWGGRSPVARESRAPSAGAEDTGLALPVAWHRAERLQAARSTASGAFSPGGNGMTQQPAPLLEAGHGPEGRQDGPGPVWGRCQNWTM